MHSIKEIRERIKRNAELCKQAHKDAVREEHEERGHVGYIKRLTGQSVPTGSHRAN
ncbi:MAG: hypothetical protein IID45_00140 [Planctomycetes bacterium]|nr:hypothetical protein [Planctomycetota bacterium]